VAHVVEDERFGTLREALGDELRVEAVRTGIASIGGALDFRIRCP